jgi:hypothetical protein
LKTQSFVVVLGDLHLRFQSNRSLAFNIAAQVRRSRMRTIVVCATTLSVCLWALLTWSAPALAQTPKPEPDLLGRHCVRTGEIPLNFCGCTWGAVYYRGHPVTGAEATLTYRDETISTTAAFQPAEVYPYFTTDAYDLGARTGDLLTLTISFAGQTVSRTFRAQPGAGGEQQINVALADEGVWTPLLSGGYTRTLTFDGHQLWAGGPAGLVQVDVQTGNETSIPLPWANPTVHALVIDADGRVWAAGPGGLAFFDTNDKQWTPQTPPFSGPVRALATSLDRGIVWAAGGDQNGGLAHFDGEWQAVSIDVAAPLLAITVDADGEPWVSVADDGVRRKIGDRWEDYSGAESQLGDSINTLVADHKAVWLGGNYASFSDGIRGGVARYTLAADAWRVFSATDPGPGMTLTDENILALAVNRHGVLWAGTTQGIYTVAGDHLFHFHPPGSGQITALADANDDLIAATTAGLFRLDRTQIAGRPPVVQPQLERFTGLVSQVITLTANANDQELDDNQIVAWDWQAEGIGPLCTTAQHCVLPPGKLQPGHYTVTVQVQDDEGVWSEQTAISLRVLAPPLYMPVVWSR